MHCKTTPLRTGVFQYAEEVMLWFLFLSTSLVFSTSLDVQFSLPKLAVLRFCSLLLILLWTFRIIREEAKPVPRSVLITGAALAGCWILSSFSALHISTALNGVYGRYNGLWSHLNWLLLFFLTASLPADEQRIERFTKSFVISLVPVAVYALIQHFGLDPISWPSLRPASTIGHPVTLSALLGLAIPFALFFALRKQNHLFWICTVLLFVFASFVTLSRGPWVGTATAVALLLLLLKMRKVIVFSRKTALVSGIILLAVIALILNFRETGELKARIKTLSSFSADDSILGRIIYSKAALSSISNHPITGTGFESFRLVYPGFRPKEDSRIFLNTTPTKVHNGYLQTALDNGIPALLFYLLFLWTVLHLLIRAFSTEDGKDGVRTWSAVFISSIVGFLVQDLSSWTDTALTPFFWIVLGLSVSHCCGSNRMGVMRLTQRRILVGFAVLACLFLGMLSIQTMTELSANALFREAQILDLAEQWPVIDAKLTEGLAKVPEDFYCKDMASVLIIKKMAQSGDKKLYEKAAVLLDSAALNNPYDISVLIHRTELDAIAVRRGIILKPTSGALSSSEKMRSMDRNNPVVFIAAARLNSSSGLRREAEELLDTAESLRSGDPETAMIRGYLYSLSGEQESSARYYQKAVYAYEQMGNYQEGWIEAKILLARSMQLSGRSIKAIDELSEVIRLFPSLADPYLVMGDIYASQNMPDKAYAAFSRALQIRPNDAPAQEGIRRLKPRLSIRDQRGL